MVGRGEPTDAAWAAIAPLLPANGGRGKQWRDHRQVIPHRIPERDDQRARRARRPGRKPAFDPATYRRRNVVERCVNRLKQWRAVATLFEKRAANYQAMLTIAAILLWP